MEKLNFERLRNIIAGFGGVKIIVVGDLILDEFIWGTVSRISPEAPVPIVWVKSESFMPGGACNVANNIISLGGKVCLSGVIGDDEKGAILKGELESKGADVSGIIIDETRKTTLKTRVVAHHQQVVRIDKETIEPLRDGPRDRVTSCVKKALKDSDALIVEDYGKGLITPRLLEEIVPLAKKLKRIVAVDPKEEHFSYYKGVTLITPNASEAGKAAGMEIKDDASLFAAGKKVLKELGCRILLITLGENGMCIFEKGVRPKQIPTKAQEVFDVSGAGDTVIAAYTLALAAGASPEEAAHISNFAAGVVVGKVGTATVASEELINKIKLEMKG